MSWLKNHLRHFVLPGIHTLSRANGKALTALDIKPRDKAIRPSTKCKFVEAGMLYSTIASVLRKNDPIREVALGLCRQVGRAKDAEFVYEIDGRGGIKGLGEGYDGVEGSDVLHSMLCNSMRRLKRQMRRKGSLLLPGRDVWCWEVLAQKLTVQSTFDSRVSRSVARNPKAIKTCIETWQIKDWSDVLFFDTGFSGTIPRAIAHAEGLEEINMLLLSSYDSSKQIFRTHTGSRRKALAFEYLAKYFLSGTHRDGEPYQELSTLDEFIKSSLLTIWLWHHVSPTRLPAFRDKKLPRSGKGKLTAGIATAGQWTTSTGQWTTSTPLADPIWTVNMNAATTSLNLPMTGLTGDWGHESATTLNHLWGAGTSGQVIVDGITHQPPKTSLQSFQDEWKQAMDQQIIGELMTKVGGDIDKISTDLVPPHLLFEQVPVSNPKKTPGAMKLKYIDPAMLQLASGKSKPSFEVAQNLKTLGIDATVAIAPLKPTEEGYDVGQYPGPPVVSAEKLKKLAGMDPNASALPVIDLKIMTLSPKPGEQFGEFVKQAIVMKPDGTKTIFQSPITG